MLPFTADYVEYLNHVYARWIFKFKICIILLACHFPKWPQFGQYNNFLNNVFRTNIHSLELLSCVHQTHPWRD